MGLHKSGLIVLAFAIAGCALSSSAQTPQPTSTPESQTTGDQAAQPAATLQTAGISGTVVDFVGNPIAAHVQLTRESQSSGQEVIADANGQYVFTNLAPGPYRLTVTALAFVSQTFSGTLAPGEVKNFPPIALAVQGGSTTAVIPEQSADAHITGTISGTVVDASGAVVGGAHVKLARESQSRESQSKDREGISDAQGQYSFSNVAAGSFQLTITAKGFAPQTSSGTLAPGEAQTVPPIALAVATASTEVQVTPSRVAEAELEIKEEEKQRVLAVIPNFYVSYVPDAAPLNTRQKFQLAWKSTFDPVSFGIIGIVAGMEQAQNQYEGYGQGAQGYGKRYGAALADNVSGSFIASFLLPSVFKQDPRYFYKGTGSKSSRFWYAMASAVICKGDNGHWQPNYSNIVGDFAAGAISNAYYPDADRGASLTVENAVVGIGSSAIAAVFQEFVVKKFTPHAKKDQTKP